MGKPSRNSSSDADMKKFQTIGLNDSAKGEINDRREKEENQNTNLKGGSIVKLSELKIPPEANEITGVVVSPEYLRYLESLANERGVKVSKNFSADFTGMCIRHLIDSGYQISGTTEEQRILMQDTIDFMPQYQNVVSTQKEFFLKGGVK